MDCLFCKIITGHVPSTKQYEDEDLLVIHDIHPAMPTHLLLLPKKHIENLFFVEPSDKDLLGKLLMTTKKLALDLQIGDEGFKLRVSNGANAGQEVNHLHVHFLSSKIAK